MAIEAAVEEGSGPRAKQGGSRKLMIMAAAGLLVLLVAGAALYFFVFAGRGTADAAAHAAVHESFIFNLPPMTVNLNDDGAEGDQFLKLTIALEVADEAVMTEIQPRMAKVIDAFQVYLRELRKSDLEGSAGIYRLKEELMRRINIAIFPAKVDGILFKEILVQ
ncbi:MAG TPA: flagellar basal body-associated FliL family protein [Devosia sp.]|jgi:flagellar FliL protein|nr:flagellar basal body-associated FliL family protein [Devosia sp.]